MEKIHLKEGPSMRSTVFDTFPRIMRHTEEKDEASRRRIVIEFLGRYVSPGGVEPYTELLNRFGQLASSAVEGHFAAHRLVYY